MNETNENLKIGVEAKGRSINFGSSRNGKCRTVGRNYSDKEIQEMEEESWLLKI